MRKDLNGAVQAYFLWHGESLLAELDATATGKGAEYSYYRGLDNPHAVIIGTTPYFAHVDGKGNVIALTDSATRTVQRSYDFDSWGGLLGGSDVKPFAGADRARFKGALWLGPEADLYYLRARWYEPKTGRFLSEDPIGIAGGLNPYTFAANDPVNGRDPTGLLTCRDGVLIIIDDEPVGCTRELLDMVDDWLTEHHGMSLDAAWAVGGYTSYFTDGRRETICPAGFRSWMCERIAGALAKILANPYAYKDARCFDIGLSLAGRFQHGQFRLVYGFIHDGGEIYVGHAARGGVMELSTRAFSRTYNLATVLAHEESHFHWFDPTESLHRRVGNLCSGGDARVMP